MEKKRKTLISILLVLSIVLITVGTTYAWFSYSKTGNEENTISSGTIKFHYAEGNRNIELVDALPMTDAEGMSQANVFDFTITSETSSTIEVPYYVTVRRSAGSDTNLDSQVKVYLTRVEGEAPNEVETPVLLVTNKYISKFNNLGTYTNPSITIPPSEKALFTSVVPANSNNYSQKYRLRMWIDEKTNFSPIKKYFCGTTEITQADYDNTEYTCQSGEKNVQDVYPYNNITYTLSVNVYSEGQIYQASNTPTIESCPGCRFVYNPETNYYFGEDNASTLNVSDTVADYTQLNSDKFLGFVLSDGDHGTIERAFICGIKRESTEAALETGTPFCIEGSVNDARGGDATTKAITYNNNAATVSSQLLWDNKCKVNQPYAFNNFGEYYTCDWNSLHIAFYEIGYAYIREPNTTYGEHVMFCGVFYDSAKAVCETVTN